MSDSTTRICLWSGPRNVSTALMYSFAQRPDTQVFDEPLYGHYLRVSNASDYHPGAEEVLNTMDCDGDSVVEMMLGEHNKPVVFFKQMTHHLIDLDRSFLSRGQEHFSDKESGRDDHFVCQGDPKSSDARHWR